MADSSGSTRTDGKQPDGCLLPDAFKYILLVKSPKGDCRPERLASARQGKSDKQDKRSALLANGWLEQKGISWLKPEIQIERTVKPGRRILKWTARLVKL